MTTKLHGTMSIPIFGEDQTILRNEDMPFMLKITDKKISCNDWTLGSNFVAPQEKSLSCRFEEIETRNGPDNNPYRIISFTGAYDAKIWNRLTQSCGFTPKIELQFWDYSEIHVGCWFKEDREVEFRAFSAKLDKDSSIALEKLWITNLTSLVSNF